jgi:hypothetical protein
MLFFVGAYVSLPSVLDTSGTFININIRKMGCLVMTCYNTHNVEKSQSDLVTNARNLYTRFYWM